MEDRSKIPELEDAGVAEMHIVAMHAWQAGCPQVTADPAHIVALADEVLVGRQSAGRESAAHRLTETNRCLRVVDDIIAAALARRSDHHAVTWLHAVRTAIVDGLDPAAATADINDAANAGEATDV